MKGGLEDRASCRLISVKEQKLKTMLMYLFLPILKKKEKKKDGNINKDLLVNPRWNS